MKVPQQILGVLMFWAGITVAVILGRYAYSTAMSHLLPPTQELLGETST